jgi:formate hydrogenlyase transcriptional activator
VQQAEETQIKAESELIMGIFHDKSQSTAATELRLHAEERACPQPAAGHAYHSEDESQLVHELEVHQVELEAQNDELRQARAESELSRNKYAELYDFAPGGYFTFDTRGVIREVNLSGALLLGREKVQLSNTLFTSFIADHEGRQIFSDHLRSVLQSQGVQRCELKLKGKDGSVIHGQLQSVIVDAVGSHDGSILSSIIDDTAGKKVGDDLQRSHDNLEHLVSERTSALRLEIEERSRAEQSLQVAYAEIQRLKDRLLAENIYLQQEVARQYNFGEIIGNSKALVQVFERVEQVAPMNATVLLLGETGTGKGVVARAIHSTSARRDRPLITVNCTTLPATLVESELFGREKGAFTGAYDRQIGRFELANGGTIFLDEIGEMPAELQCKLLRVIQDGEFERLGSSRTQKTDVRIIAATNRDLAKEIKNGRFREDLFYRLNVFPITMPPLRERRDDIPLLVSHFVAKFNKKIGKKIESVSKETLNSLQRYGWPGNVRELESVLERAVITSQGSTLQVLDRFENIPEAAADAGCEVKALVELEYNHILQVLLKTGWRIEGPNGAALILGLNASTLRARMRKYGIART